MTTFRSTSVFKLRALRAELIRQGYTCSDVRSSERWDETPFVTTSASNRDIMHALRAL